MIQDELWWDGWPLLAPNGASTNPTIPTTPRQGSRNLLESVEAYLVQDWVRTLKRREVGKEASHHQHHHQQQQQEEQQQQQQQQQEQEQQTQQRHNSKNNNNNNNNNKGTTATTKAQQQEQQQQLPLALKVLCVLMWTSADECLIRCVFVIIMFQGLEALFNQNQIHPTLCE